MVDIGVDNEQDRLMFKRIFILYIQMAFLLPTTINKISPVHLAPIFEMDTITERNWGGHALSFIIKGITDYKLKKKKAIDGCLFALMIIYFHLSKNKDKKRAERPPEPWIANWSKEQLVERMRAKIEEHMSKKRKKNQEDSDSESESTDKTQSKKKKVIVEDSSPEQAQSYHGSEIRTEDLDEFLRENNEKSAAEGEKETDLRSTEGHYVSSETISDVNLGSDDPSSQGHTEQSSVNKPAESMLSLVEESASEPAEENMVVVREEIPSEALAMNYRKLRNTLGCIFGYSLALLNPPPQQLEESTPTLSPAPSNINPAPEDAVTLMMMTRTASYTYANGLTNEFDTVCTLQAQDRYTLSKLHLASLAPETHIEAEIVSAMCFILNQQKIKRFQEEVYCLPPDIVGAPLKSRDKDKEIVPPYIHISGQKTSYDYAIYVMKWLEIFEPANIKRRKYEWDNWTQHEVDHFRVEYASQILFHDMNQDKAEAIRGSNVIRLSKSSSLLLSPYCQIDSKDIDTN
ncbi:uncharacterized protein DS421_20g692340 [Arachis hypogaea]|nr:uncharacterized protein DS421_20g692340 [Arachis hypogaea]